MKAVFADTFYWVALTNPADPHNRVVVTAARESAQATILTTDAVLTEFLTFFAENTHWRNRAAQTVQALLDAPEVTILSAKADQPSWPCSSFIAAGRTKDIA